MSAHVSMCYLIDLLSENPDSSFANLYSHHNFSRYIMSYFGSDFSNMTQQHLDSFSIPRMEKAYMHKYKPFIEWCRSKKIDPLYHSPERNW